MDVEIPTVTLLAGANITDVMSAWHAYLLAGTSTKWRLHPGVTGHGVHGFVLQRIDGGGAQHSVRKPSTSQLNVTTDRSNSITAAGNTSTAPTGASATESPAEQSFTSIPLTLDGALLLEYAEAVWLLLRATATSHSHTIGFGQIYTPEWGNGSAWGNEGYGILNSASTVFSGVCNCRTGGTRAQNWPSITDQASGGVASVSGQLGATGLYLPQLSRHYLTGYSWHFVGSLRHVVRPGDSRTPRSVYQTASGDYVYYAGTANPSAFAWAWDPDTLVAP